MARTQGQTCPASVCSIFMLTLSEEFCGLAKMPISILSLLWRYAARGKGPPFSALPPRRSLIFSSRGDGHE